MTRWKNCRCNFVKKERFIYVLGLVLKREAFYFHNTRWIFFSNVISFSNNGVRTVSFSSVIVKIRTYVKTWKNCFHDWIHYSLYDFFFHHFIELWASRNLLGFSAFLSFDPNIRRSIKRLKKKKNHTSKGKTSIFKMMVYVITKKNFLSTFEFYWTLNVRVRNVGNFCRLILTFNARQND